MSQTVSIRDLALVIRSKNAGPFELTFDMIFKDRAAFDQVVSSKVITKELIAKLYQIPVEKVLYFVEFPAANAIKATIVRPTDSGSVGDTDVYGAQQHAPLLDIRIPAGNLLGG